MARGSGASEIHRDCELFIALGALGALGAPESRRAGDFWRVCYGTPFPAYRERALRLWGAEGGRPAEVRVGEGKAWRLGSVDDLRRLGLKPGQLPARLFISLWRDLFQPPTASSLCDLIFPGEHFHPLHSPLKLHQVLGRLRKTVSFRGFKVLEQNGHYQVAGKGAVLIPESLEPALSIDAIDNLRSLPSFTTQEAAKSLGIAARSLSRRLKEAEEQGLLFRVGAGRCTRYEWRS